MIFSLKPDIESEIFGQTRKKESWIQEYVYSTKVLPSVFLKSGYEARCGSGQYTFIYAKKYLSASSVVYM